MSKSSKKARILAALLVFVLLFSTAAQARITTPERNLSADTYGYATQYINTAWGRKNYKLTYQGASSSSFIRGKGCGFCCVTTVLNALKRGYANLTPETLHGKLEKKTFGNIKNVGITTYGSYRILKKAGVKVRYIKNFNRKTIGKTITNHLYKGKPIIVSTSAYNQVTGVKDQRWAMYAHDLLLLGMTNTGKVIVYDSNNRGWNNRSQRIKLCTIGELTQYLLRVPGSPTNRYSGASRCGGICLIG